MPSPGQCREILSWHGMLLIRDREAWLLVPVLLQDEPDCSYGTTCPVDALEVGLLTFTYRDLGPGPYRRRLAAVILERDAAALENLT